MGEGHYPQGISTDIVPRPVFESSFIIAHLCFMSVTDWLVVWSESQIDTDDTDSTDWIAVFVIPALPPSTSFPQSVPSMNLSNP